MTVLDIDVDFYLLSRSPLPSPLFLLFLLQIFLNISPSSTIPHFYSTLLLLLLPLLLFLLLPPHRLRIDPHLGKRVTLMYLFLLYFDALY